MATDIEIIDGSGDKEHFTIIPNYIANHSTAIDQALYFQMKRYAGESGRCFATEETLMNKLGVGRKSLHKSLKYLTDHGWIGFVGLTSGRTRPIRTYKINNIWKLNSDYYKKIPSERAVSMAKEGDTVQKSSKILSKRAVEEEPVKQDNTATPPLPTKTKKMKSNSFRYREDSHQDYEEVIDADTGEPVVEVKKATGKTQELLKWAESRRGSPFFKQSHLKQLRAFRVAKDNGLHSEELKNRWIEFEKDKFWSSKGYDWMDVVMSFNKKR